VGGVIATTGVDVDAVDNGDTDDDVEDGGD